MGASLNIAPMSEWTYGSEIEWADVDRTRALPEGAKWDDKELTVMNTNGVAVDGTGRHWKFGGELHPKPTAPGEKQAVEKLALRFKELRTLFPEARLTHRNGVHYHVRIPGLAEDLDALKSLQRYIHNELKAALPHLEPIASNEDDFEDAEDRKLARWHHKRMLRSHQTFVPPARLEAQIIAQTVDAFFDAECPKHERDGKERALHHLQPRACVNLRQLKQTGTIEFRHFFSTLDWVEFRSGLIWCVRFIDHWIRGTPAETLIEEAKREAKHIPKQWPPFCPVLERRFRETAWDGTIDKKLAKANADKLHSLYPLPQEPISPKRKSQTELF